MHWKLLPPTEKQINLIRDLESDYKHFTGHTRGEASDYIDEAIAYYKKRAEEDGWYNPHEDAGDRI